ncbi:hypothetical protein [Acetobacter cibinongensis]|uniref:Uncharacterized protein n=1 Tax=Acetobacter cibinongensis TaxID=146475 RepID=A0A1Z5YVZ3_9PROT|nr:hypothetical protein [Acetobacter cibinongensis]OUJ03172.1 hypothetical protein HK14_03130 [Acetobacter cibinongensis]
MKTLKQAGYQHEPLVTTAEKLLVGAASLAGKAATTYAGVSNTAVGEVVRVASFIALGSVLMCQTDIGWWLLGVWSDKITNLVLYMQGVA